MKKRKTDGRAAAYIVLTAILAVSTIWHVQAKAFHDAAARFFDDYFLHSSDYEKAEPPSRSSLTNITMYGWQKATKARNHAIMEMQSFNIQETPYNYYTLPGTFLDCYDQNIFDLDTLLPGDQTTSEYLNSLHRVCAYLYGDSTQINTLYGYNAWMRISENPSDDSMNFLDGRSISLTIDTFREQQIYELFRINGIKGGCIIQNPENGAIEVMTATSITSTDSAGSGLTQLEACLNPEPLLSSVTEEEARQYFDYQSYQTIMQTPDGNIAKYCFSTDFDIIEESEIKDPISLISPLHMNMITQRIFTGKKYLPTFRKDFCQEEAISGDLSALQQLYQKQTFQPADAEIQVLENKAESDFYYATGILHSDQGDKIFTLYGRDPVISKFIECLALIYGKDGAEREVSLES